MAIHLNSNLGRSVTLKFSNKAASVQQGLYDPQFEHDSCGVGFITRISSTPSFEVLQMGLEALSRLAHRGAIAADGRSGDGAGITASMPHGLLRTFLREHGLQIGADLPLAVGMIFAAPEELAVSEEILSSALKQEQLTLLCWRDVPVNEEALGATALNSMPVIR